MIRYILVGHSYGSAVSLQYNILYPGEVKGIGKLFSGGGRLQRENSPWFGLFSHTQAKKKLVLFCFP